MTDKVARGRADAERRWALVATDVRFAKRRNETECTSMLIERFVEHSEISAAMAARLVEIAEGENLSASLAVRDGSLVIDLSWE